jgi:hypothetical protein
MKKQIKPNLERLMIRVIILLCLILTVFSSCKKNRNKEIKVYLDGDKYGWYFVFLEHIDDSTYNKKPITVYLNEKNFIVIKLYKPENYRLKIYDFKTKNEISDNMRLVSYSGDYKRIMRWSFYYPDFNLEPDEIFTNTKFDNKEYEIQSKITRKGHFMEDSIIKYNNIDWWIKVD